MDESLKLYWKLYFENKSTDEILQENNCFRNYKEEMIDGPILDIGCGQSQILLDFIDSDRKIFAIDNEQLQLDYLKQRAVAKNPNKIENWNFLNIDFRNNQFPMQNYSLIVCSDLLHFFTLQECNDIVKHWSKITTRGTLLYIRVHSKRHPINHESYQQNYFKTFFSEEDLNQIFEEDKYEKIYQSEAVYNNSSNELKLINLWLDKWFESINETDLEYIKEEKAEYKKNKEANITIIYKKK